MVSWIASLALVLVGNSLIASASATASPVLLPVWIASFEHAGQTHHVYVNGQTGTVTGHVPRSGLKIAFAVLLTLAFVVTAWYLLAEALS